MIRVASFLVMFSFVTTSLATEKWNIVVLPQFDKQSLVATHRAYQIVSAQISDTLLTEFGFDVYSGASLGISLSCQKECDQSTYQKTINAVRKANQKTKRNPIDLIVFFQINAKNIQASLSTSQIVNVSLSALDIETDKLIFFDDDSARYDGARYDTSARYDGDWLNRQAKLQARNSAVFIGERLQSYARMFEYSITLRDFIPSEILTFKNVLTKHPSYESGQLKSKEAGEPRQHLLHTLSTQSFYLKSSMGGGQLQELMQDFLDDERIQATVNYNIQTRGVRIFEVDRVGVAHFYSYIFAVLGFVLFIIAIVLLGYNRKFNTFKKLRLKALFLKTKQSKQTHSFDLKEVLELKGELTGVTLLSKNVLLIGRPASASKTGNSKADIEINFKHISRPQKQCKLERVGNSFELSDMHSTHGTALDGNLLTGGRAEVLQGSQVLALGGTNENNNLGPCRINLQVLQTKGALLLQLDQKILSLYDQASLVKVWPTLETDVQKKWACFLTEIPVCEIDGELALGEESVPLFYFTYQNGFGVRPANFAETTCLSIDGIEVLGNVPLQSGAELMVGQHKIIIP